MARHHDNARERILDGFEDALITNGDAQVTLEGVAKHVGLTKGGLLYHFGSRAALVAGLVERFQERSAEDLVLMADSPGGAALDYLEVGDYLTNPLHRTTLAMTQLSNSEPTAAAPLGRSRTEELAVITADLGDPTLARLTMLVADGLYFQAMTAPVADPAHTEAPNDAAVTWFIQRVLGVHVAKQD
ncbi:MAG TPA: TetR/AcrR family transcriptional regulator [Propionibacteriaceae bacterium]